MACHEDDPNYKIFLSPVTTYVIICFLINLL